jgi:LPXTG-motif cell wall-anchored protein
MEEKKMKKLKTLISVVLSAMLVLSLVVPSMADKTATTIKINGNVGQEAGETYTAYKIFDLDYVNNAGVYTVSEAVLKIIPEAKIESFGLSVKEEKGNDGNRYVEATEAYTEAKAGEFAEYLNSIVKNLKTLPKAEAVSVMTGNIPVATIDVSSLGAGYYFVDTTIGAVCALDNTTPGAVITDKNTDVTVDKVIVEDANANKNSVQIGDEVKFETTVYIPESAEDVVLHDKMDEGFTFNNNIVIEGLTEGTDYTVVTDDVDDNCTFEVVFAETWLTKANRPTEVVVAYSAELNDKALIMNSAASEATNKNETYATFGADQKTNVDYTETVTAQFTLKKVIKDTETLLAGAKFNLVIDGDVINLVKVSATEYRIADSDDTANVTDEIVSIDTGDGVITIKGLDADVAYQLVETEAPAGYNKLASPIDVDEFVLETVENSTGTFLPTTGGMGTKVLFTVGGIMMVVAFVLFTSKRRMAAED